MKTLGAAFAAVGAITDTPTLMICAGSRVYVTPSCPDIATRECVSARRAGGRVWQLSRYEKPRMISSGLISSKLVLSPL